MLDIIGRITDRYNAGEISAEQAYHAICNLHFVFWE